MIRFLSLVVVAFTVLPATAGYYMEHEAVIPNPATMQPMRTTIRSWHEGRRFKRESPLRRETVIIDLDRGQVIGINDTSRTYWKLSTEKYRQLALMSLLVMGVQMQPGGGISVPEGLFRRTGKTAKIAGRDAYEVAVHGKLPPGMTTSFWLSKEVDVPIAKMVDELRLALGDPKESSFQSLFNQWLALDGYPVQTVTQVNTPRGNIITSETLLEVKIESMDDAVFAVPRGYALTEDPISVAERAMAQQMKQRSPVGLGAPIQTKPAKKGP